MESLRNKAYNLLRRSESLFKTDMVYAAKGGFWISFGQGMSSLLSLFLIIAFANLLPKETYGMYKYILSLAGILNIFTLTGMNSAVSQTVAVGHDGALRSSVRYQLKWNLLMLLAFWILSGYYFMQGDDLLSISFLTLGAFIPATLALNTYGAYLDGKREFKLASLATMGSTVIYVIGVLAAIFLSGEVIWIIFAYAATTFVSTLFFYFFTIKKFKPPAEDGGEVLRYGRKLTYVGFIGPVASQIDEIILTHFWGPAQLAIYALALAVPEKAVALLKNWVGIGLPKFSVKTAAELNTVFYRRIFKGILIGALAALIYVALAPYLFKYLLPQYLDSILYSQILALSFLFAIPNRYISLLLVSQKMSGAIFANSALQSVLQILFYVVLGIWGGIMGLILANVIFNFVGMIANISIWRLNSRGI